MEGRTMKLTFEQKLEHARALFEKATGHKASPNWTGQTEEQLDILIWAFNGMIANDPYVLRVLRRAMLGKVSAQ